MTALVGRVLKTVDAGGSHDHILETPEAHAEALATQFGINLPDAAGLWPEIARRHDELFGPS